MNYEEEWTLHIIKTTYLPCYSGKSKFLRHGRLGWKRHHWRRHQQKNIKSAERSQPTARLSRFNDLTKLGSGKEMIDTLENLILIFNKPELDFSKNKAEGDGISGDAYEYLMRHFESEIGKVSDNFIRLRK